MVVQPPFPSVSNSRKIIFITQWSHLLFLFPHAFIISFSAHEFYTSVYVELDHCLLTAYRFLMNSRYDWFKGFHLRASGLHECTWTAFLYLYSSGLWGCWSHDVMYACAFLSKAVFLLCLLPFFFLILYQSFMSAMKLTQYYSLPWSI